MCICVGSPRPQQRRRVTHGGVIVWQKQKSMHGLQSRQVVGGPSLRNSACSKVSSPNLRQLLSGVIMGAVSPQLMTSSSAGQTTSLGWSTVGQRLVRPPLKLYLLLSLDGLRSSSVTQSCSCLLGITGKPSPASCKADLKDCHIISTPLH